MKRFSHYMLGLLMLSFSMAQPLHPNRYSLAATGFDSSAYRGLKSSQIGEIRLQGDSLVWLGTGAGLAVLRDTASVFTLQATADVSSGTLTDKVPQGTVTAIAVKGDTLFAAFSVNSKNIAAGNGLIYTANSTDSSITWTYFDQPVDAAGDSISPFAKRFFRALPITVKEANVTYDATIAGGYIWITSWAGGLRRYSLKEKVWERVPLPQDADQTLNTCEAASYETTSAGPTLKNYFLNPRDPWDGVSQPSSDPLAYGNHNHKAFSVLAYGDTVWVGTANGINRGILGNNGCVDWVHYTPDRDGLSGGFVVGLAKQDFMGYRVIWAVTVTAGGSEISGISYTIDDGDTWYTTLRGERCYNIVTGDSLVLVASEKGLWKFIDENPLDVEKPWALYKPARQALPIGSTGAFQTDAILSNKVIAVAYETRPFYTTTATLWIGTPDGLGRALDIQGENWQIFRPEFTPSKVYAYPNPFSPYTHNQLDGDGYVHIHTDVKTSFVINMDIYNFAMEQVYTQAFDRRLTSSGALRWNGRDKNGRLVANGTYLIRLEYDNKVEWLKLIVLK
jgi:hypothetical protein